MKFTKPRIARLAASIVICQLAGVIGSFFTSPSIPGWYASLVKPSFNPPNWIFGPVWISLYLLMGISLFLVWDKASKNKFAKIAIGIFAFQLVLNSIWSILFFGMQSPIYAFIEIIILWAAILASIIAFYRVSAPAASLLLPYILWVSFAAVLNFFIWRLNL